MIFYKIYCGEDTKREMGVIAVYVEHNNYYKKLIGKDLKEVFGRSSKTLKHICRISSDGNISKGTLS